MQAKITIPRLLGALLYSFGLILFLGLAILGIWPDLEASLFDSSTVTEAPLRGLTCPIALAADEVGTIRVKFENPLDRPMQFLVRARISEGSVLMMRQFSTIVAMDVGESEEVSWQVTPADAAFGSFVMARVHAYRSYPLPSRQRACGIGVLPISGVKGSVVVAATALIALLSIGAGALTWYRREYPLSDSKRDMFRGFVIVTGLMLIATIVGFLGLWLPGLLSLVGVVIVAASMTERFLLR